MKKIIFIILPALLLFSSCKKDLTSININPKQPQTVAAATLYTNAQKNLVDLLTSTNVNTNIFRLIVQYWTETTYTDESNFDLNTRQIPRQIWNGLYRDVLENLRTSKSLIPNETYNNNAQANTAIIANRLAEAEILEIVTWYYIVTTFGNVPYSQALDINTPQPKYDDQKTIYNDLLARLDAAIAKLNTNYSGLGSADLIYNGDVASWKKFANSFKLKMAMTIADVDNTKAKAAAESAVASGVFTSNADNATFKYLSAPPNTNPVWVDLIQSNRQDFVVTTTVTNKLVALNDPRIPYYFTKDPNGTYTGGDPGASNNFASLSKPAGLNKIKFADQTDIGNIANPDFPALLLSYDEVEFFLAEAVQRGYNVGGTAVQHYNNAITASILWWGGTQAQATTYLAQPAVAYNAANWRKSIGEQKWIALYNRGWDEWIEWRRLDYPQLTAPSSALTAIPLRLTYPIPEQNVNTSNYNAAVSAMGGDVVTKKLFWDVN